MKCPKCQGESIIIVGAVNIPWVECDLCKGTGKFTPKSMFSHIEQVMNDRLSGHFDLGAKETTAEVIFETDGKNIRLISVNFKPTHEVPK